MLSESSTIIDFFGAEKLMADGQYLAAADAYYSCWERINDSQCAGEGRVADRGHQSP